MAGLAEALLGATAGYAKSAQSTGLEKARKAREQAYRNEGWSREDARIADQRGYQAEQKAEERSYQQEQKSEDRAYQEGVKAEERKFRSQEADKSRVASAAEREADRELKREKSAKTGKSSAEVKADLAKEEKSEEKAKAYESTVTTLDSVNELLGHKGLRSAVGASSLLPTIPGGDAADFEVALDSFVGNLTLENMSKMSGVLSDSDIKILKNASSGLDIKMSEGEFMNRLNKIRDKLQTKIYDYEEGFPKSSATQPTSEQSELPQFSQIGRFNVRVK